MMQLISSTILLLISSIILSFLPLSCLADLAMVQARLQNSEFMNNLESHILNCFNSKNEKVLDCSDLEYIHSVHGLLGELRHQGRLQSSIRVEEAAEDGSYASIFQTKVINDIPFKGEMPMSLFSASDALAKCVSEFGVKLDLTNRDFPLKDCAVKYKDVYTNLVLPRVVGNNYLFRKGFEGSSDPQGIITDYASHWPAFLPLYDVQPGVESCPRGMHMVVWGLPATTRARLFLKQASTYILQPDYGISVPHYFEFKSSGFLTSSAADISSDLYFETSIGENEFIFVPQTMVISIDNSHTGTNTAAIKMCYVDASNFKRFTELLRLDFKATGDESIWKQMRELESLNFDYHMLREPPTLMYHSEGLRAEAAGQSSGSEKGTATRRNRGAGMRDVNEAAQWTTLITALTLPTPPAPVITHTGRLNATIQWDSPYSPSSQDETRFGFVINVCEALNRSRCSTAELEKSDLKRSMKRLELEQPIYSTVISKALAPSTAYVSRVTIFYGSTIGTPSDWSRAAWTDSVREPSPVGPVSVALDSEIANSVLLTFERPVDDGGSLIKGYSVFLSRLDMNENEPHIELLGLFNPHFVSATSSTLSIQIHNLLPGFSYMFGVAAVNEIGDSAVVYSGEIETPLATTRLIKLISVMRTPLNHSTDSFPVAGDVGWSPSTRRLVTSEDLQTITLVEGTKELFTIPVWASHWNPKLEIIAEAAWAVPLLADQPLRNPQDLRGRLAVVHRGGIPFSAKARSVGAVGCVIVDDGQCGSLFNQHCVPGADKSRGERFAALDAASSWTAVKIPVYLVLRKDWDALLARWTLSPAAADALRELQRLADLTRNDEL